MDQARRETPSPRSTPVKQSESRPRHTAYQNNAGCFTVLPSHITPPSGLTVVGRNPFEIGLTSRLHRSMISPNVFFNKISSSSQQQSPDFKWSIDELAHIRPAKIEESVAQQAQSPDPEVELKAQQAIDRFFKENQIIPSPWQVREKDNNKPDSDMGTPVSRPLESLNSSKEFPKAKRDVWSQTVLSLPVDLPQNVEDALKSFFTFTQDQTADNDDVNSSNSSLRRKLFFNHDECVDHDNESRVSSSSVEMSGSMMLSCSPPQSGMFIRGTLKGSLKRQSNGSESLSSPYVSPIKDSEGELYKILGCLSQWDTQSDHITNMSIEDVNVEERRNSNDGATLGKDISCDTNDMKRIEDNRALITINSEKLNVCDAISTEMLSKYANPVDGANTHSVLINNKYHNAANVKIVTEVKEGSSTRKSPKQNSMIFGAMDSQNISNSVQDTGYQTYMNSTMHTVDSSNYASIDRKFRSSEQIVTFRDDTQLSWRENMTNVFSSTPSRCKKEK